MTSQIAGIDILHILGNENTYMKTAQNRGFPQYPYIPTWLLASYIFSKIYIYFENIYIFSKITPGMRGWIHF